MTSVVHSQGCTAWSVIDIWLELLLLITKEVVQQWLGISNGNDTIGLKFSSIGEYRYWYNTATWLYRYWWHHFCLHKIIPYLSSPFCWQPLKMIKVACLICEGYIMWAVYRKSVLSSKKWYRCITILNVCPLPFSSKHSQLLHKIVDDISFPALLALDFMKVCTLFQQWSPQWWSLRVLCCSYLHANEKCPSVSYVCEISFTLSHCNFIPLWMNAHTHTAWSLQARWAWCHSRSIQVFPWTVPVTTRPGITSTLWWVPSTSVPGMQGGGVTLLLVLPSAIGKALNQGSLYVCTYICMWQSHLWLVSRFLACGRRISGWPLEFYLPWGWCEIFSLQDRWMSMRCLQGLQC